MDAEVRIGEALLHAVLLLVLLHAVLGLGLGLEARGSIIGGSAFRRGEVAGVPI
jgi:hypothetical protein